MVDWINLSQSSGSGYELISVTASVNTGSSRTTYLTVSGHSTYASVEVVQNAPLEILSISPSSYYFPYSGYTEVFTVYSNIPWTVVSYPNWITLTTGETSMTATTTANTSTSVLSSSIVISGNTTTASTMVEQGCIPEDLSIYPFTYTFSYTGGTQEFTIKSNTDWEITSYPNWITLSALSGTSGTSNITATATRNNYGIRPNGYIVISNTGGLTARTEVHQDEVAAEDTYMHCFITEDGYIQVQMTYAPIQYRKSRFNISTNEIIDVGNWVTIPSGTSYVNINVVYCDVLEFKATASTTTTYTRFNPRLSYSTAGFTLYGNSMSLIYGDDFRDKYDFPDSGVTMEGCFRGCTKLVNASGLVLPATALSKYYCYASMFYGCTSLTTSPELPALVTTQNCYRMMFNRCSSLSKITCLLQVVNSNNLYQWVSGVASSGLFVQNQWMSSEDWTRGTSGIPNNWTIDYK